MVEVIGSSPTAPTNRKSTRNRVLFSIGEGFDASTRRNRNLISIAKLNAPSSVNLQSKFLPPHHIIPKTNLFPEVSFSFFIFFQRLRSVFCRRVKNSNKTYERNKLAVCRLFVFSEISSVKRVCDLAEFPFAHR